MRYTFDVQVYWSFAGIEKKIVSTLQVFVITRTGYIHTSQGNTHMSSIQVMMPTFRKKREVSWLHAGMGHGKASLDFADR